MRWGGFSGRQPGFWSGISISICCISISSQDRCSASTAILRNSRDLTIESAHSAAASRSPRGSNLRDRVLLPNRHLNGNVPLVPIKTFLAPKRIMLLRYSLSTRVEQMSDEKSSAGTFLGGLAALIIAIATLYATLHHRDPPPLPNVTADTPTSKSVETSQGDGSVRKPALTYKSTPQDNGPAKASVQPQGAISTARSQAINISDYWSGLYGPGHLLLRLHADSDGQVSGSLKRECRIDRSSDSDNLPIAANSTWDGKNLQVHIDPIGGWPATIINAKLLDDTLVGTYFVLHAQAIELHRGQDACQI